MWFKPGPAECQAGTIALTLRDRVDPVVTTFPVFVEVAAELKLLCAVGTLKLFLRLLGSETTK